MTKLSQMAERTRDSVETRLETTSFAATADIFRYFAPVPLQNGELSGKLADFPVLSPYSRGGMITILILCSRFGFAAEHRWNSSLSPCDIS
jgi:hypothetical protein